MNRFILPLLVLINLFGCKSEKKEKFTYFGGKIIHPKGCDVILKNFNGFTDTISLAKDNTFMAKYPNLEEGIYTMEHGPEHQFIYIQNKDSLAFRLNTWDFDESLVFTGDNAERNNLLMDVFLQNEREKSYLLKFKKGAVDIFKAKVDSILDRKEKIFQNYKKKEKDISKEFLEMYYISLIYPVYTNLEWYSAYLHSKNRGNELNDEFYDFRKDIDLTNYKLYNYTPYYRYLVEKTYSNAFQEGCYQESQDFVVEIQDNIGKTIDDERIRNKLLFDITVHNFERKVKGNNFKKVFHNYFKWSSDIEDKKKIQKLVNDINNLENNKLIPDFKIETPKGNWVNIKDIIDKPSVILFFYEKAISRKYIVSSRMNYLVNRYPQVTFKIIHVSDEKSRKPLKYFNTLDIQYQYKLPKTSAAHKFLTSNFSRAVILDKSGTVLNNYTYLYSYDLEEQLGKLEKNGLF